jgi:nucleotide-binding universal stress UspA family protein
MDEEALLLAGETSRATKGTLFLVYIIEVPRVLPLDSPPEADLDRAETVLAEMESLGERNKLRVVTELLYARQAGPAIVREAIERQADLVVIGMDYRRRYGEFTIGESIAYILEHAPCAVWVLREPISDNNGHEPGETAGDMDARRRQPR